MSAISRQVGGTHYKDKSIQPWEVIERNQMGFFDGNALKYIMRYKDKGGVEDLRKAIHYIERLIEIECKFEQVVIGDSIRREVDEEGWCNGK